MSSPATGAWRSRWPALGESWEIYSDDALVCLNKPEGVPGPGADSGPADTIDARWARQALEGSVGGTGVGLGVHHHLGRDASGVMVFGRSREGNRGLAAQFEGRRVRTELVVGVEGWPHGQAERTLRLARAKLGHRRQRGRGRAHSKANQGVLEARVKCIASNGGRSLLRVRMGAPNLSAVRGILTESGVPIAGDSENGGAPAWRWMIHLAELRLTHPLTGEPFHVRAPRSSSLDAWLEFGGLGVPLRAGASLRVALDTAMERRWCRLGDDDAVTGHAAFRWVHREADGVQDLALDVYGDHLVAQLYRALPKEEESRLLDLLGEYGFRGVYIKRRPKQANEIVDAAGADLAPSEPVRGSAIQGGSISEHGVDYPVALGDGLSTGVFLDQRANRRRLMEAAVGKRVLNLFAYTGPFSVAAAAGGARVTVSVDASQRALDRAHAALAGFEGDHRIERCDVFEYLQKAEPFDLVIVDPPTYSTVGSKRWSSGGQWEALSASCCRRVTPGGVLLACSNDARMSLGAFARRVTAGARQAGREVVRYSHISLGDDFPPHPVHGPHLKTLWVELK